ncbi:expressed unknown protein [Seminavis robusta]|uniref:Uncharacterized protein n=1 Tax=Seminavis robusta TaxID=568900 RepID=A0A9N8HWC8_9STRA|nr:expressed unknown protein [Seminavis robusta]|eukprot:Sro1633_g287330.1 n/a (159) ;mRNA; f:5304-5780
MTFLRFLFALSLFLQVSSVVSAGTLRASIGAGVRHLSEEDAETEAPTMEQTCGCYEDEPDCLCDDEGYDGDTQAPSGDDDGGSWECPCDCKPEDKGYRPHTVKMYAIHKSLFNDEGGDEICVSTTASAAHNYNQQALCDDECLFPEGGEQGDEDEDNN